MLVKKYRNYGLVLCTIFVCFADDKEMYFLNLPVLVKLYFFLLFSHRKSFC